MFLQVFVCPSGGGRPPSPSLAGRALLIGGRLLRSGRYASYWNAFFLKMQVSLTCQHIPMVKIIKIYRCFWRTLKPHSHYACAFASVCAFAFASNCNIASMGCCVKRKEWTILCGIEPILCVWVKLQTKTHSVNGPLQCTDQGYTTQVSGETTILARRLQLLEAKHCNDGIFSQ